MVSQEVVIPDELTDHARSTIAVLHGRCFHLGVK